MSFIKKIDLGWIYLLCGLALTTAAIVLPANQDLSVLKSKKTLIATDLEELTDRVGVYGDFLFDVQQRDPQITNRLIQMQFNQSPDGTPIVIDLSAPQTPLDWVAQRAKCERIVPMTVNRASILSQVSDGQGRLWLLGAGAFAIFIGLIAKKEAVSGS